MKRVPIKVTDHAVLRYLQRVKGVDVEALKAEIAQLVHLASEHAGACSVNVDGKRYLLKNGVVITVMPKSMPNPLNRGHGK